jgi:drug/metabolite transporter (DMT)-like permease
MPTSEPPTPSSDARAWLAFAACGAIWGSTFLVISIGNDAVAPVWAATLRLLLAALLLFAVSLVRRVSLPRGRQLHAALGYGVMQFGVNFPLLYWGETIVPSGVSAVVYATIPLSSAIMARSFGLERLTVNRLVGAAVALVGVAVLFSSSFRGHVALPGLVAIFIGATAAGLGTILLKRAPTQDPFAANAVGCTVGAVMAGAASFLLREPHSFPSTFAAAWPIVYLAIAGSLGAYVIMSWLIGHWPVTRTAYVTVIVPVIALGLGALLRQERLTLPALAGAALVLVGLLVGVRAPR